MKNQKTGECSVTARPEGRRSELHRVPLSEPALAILRAMAKPKDGPELVFIRINGDVALSGMTMGAVLRRMRHRALTVHGFRSTFSDRAAEATRHPNHVVQQVLAHAVPSAVEAAY